MSSKKISDVKRVISTFERTRLIAHSKASVAKTVARVEMVLPIEFIILSVPPKSLAACI